MPAQTTPPPTNPDIKRELKQQLLNMSARSFEFFAGDFLVYAGLEAVSVTRYIGDGGIDALGDLVAGHFRVPIGIQVKRHRNNVQRPDIDTFIGALSGRFSEGIFMTTANYAPGALQKATTSIPQAQTAIALCKTMVLSTYINHRNNDTALSHPNKRCDLRCLFSSLMIKITKEEQHMETVRIGILGAARIVPSALIQPAQQLADVTVAGIAARDVVRGQGELIAIREHDVSSIAALL